MIYLLSPAFRTGLRPVTRYLLVTCAVLLTFWPIAARAEQGAIQQIPASQIFISQFRLYETTQVGRSGECVSFTNRAHLTAVRVLFLHSLIDQNGNIVYADTHEAKGEFAPGVLIQGENEVLCRHGDLNLGGGTVHHNGNLGSMVTSVAQVDYSNGTSWHAGPDIVGTSLSQPDADIHITKTFSFEPADATQECVSFSNTGTRTVRRVQFMLSHIADDGSDVVDDPLDVRNTYAPGTSQTNSCRGWNGSLTPTVGAAPDPAAQPQILVFGKPARLVSWVNTIEFTDGTSWHAPARQKDAASAAAVANQIDYSQSVWGPKVPEVVGAYTQRPASGIGITKTFMWDPGAPNECVNFVNRSTKPQFRRWCGVRLDAGFVL